MRTVLSIIAMLVGLACPAWAYDCQEVVIDNAHAITDPAAIVAAAKPLIDKDMVVRVLTVNADDLERYADTVLAKECPSWRINDGAAWVGTLLLVLYSPDANRVQVVYGIANASIFGGGRWRAAVATPKDDATQGLVLTLQRLAELPVIDVRRVHRIAEKEDSRVGGFGVLVFVVIVGLYAAGVAFNKWRKSRTTVRVKRGYDSYQSSERDMATRGAIEITDSLVIDKLEAIVNRLRGGQKAALVEDLKRFRELGQIALTELHTIAKQCDEQDPDPAYVRNLYSRVHRNVKMAKELAERIAAG